MNPEHYEIGYSTNSQCVTKQRSNFNQCHVITAVDLGGDRSYGLHADVIKDDLKVHGESDLKTVYSEDLFSIPLGASLVSFGKVLNNMSQWGCWGARLIKEHLTSALS